MSPNGSVDFVMIGAAIIPIIILLLVFKRLIFRNNLETVLRKLCLYGLVLIVSVVLYSFGSGEGGFVQRLENIPSVQSIVAYGGATIIVLGFDLLISAFRRK